MIPAWAPNLHPLVVHFPIGLLVAAVLVDVAALLLQRPAWIGTMAASLYAAGAASAVAAYLTGARAAVTVFLPGPANPIVNDHRTWALATTWYVGLTALARLGAGWAGAPRSRRWRLLWLVIALVGVLILYQAAERGGRLVYEHGVGVIAAPTAR